MAEEHLTREEICDYMNWVIATVVDGANVSFLQRLAVMALAYVDTQEYKILKEEIKRKKLVVTLGAESRKTALSDYQQGLIDAFNDVLDLL